MKLILTILTTAIMVVTAYLIVDDMFITGYAAKELPCTKECCDADGVEARACPEPYVCAGYRCELPDCPYECCDGLLYKEKGCGNGVQCHGYSFSCVGRG